MHRLWSVIMVGLALTILGSCNPKKGNMLGRTYRNFTSFFNGFYHARLKYKEGTTKTEQNFKVPEDGSFITIGIPTLDEAKSGFADFDEVVKKCDVIIFKHRKKKNQEPLVEWIYKYNNWVDDARILIGKAWFTKQNYILAQQNFAYVLTAFPNSKNRPEAYLWLAKTQLANENPFAAKQNLDKMFQEPFNIPKSIQAEANQLYAMLNIQIDKNYDQAIQSLETALLYQKGKKNKAKIHYLLGQLYDAKQNYPQAIEHFQKVVKINPSNQMVFNALLQINKINVKFLPDGSDMQLQAKAFHKLLKDVKYEEFKDQIYYELAMIELKQKNKPKAIELLKSSTAASKSNTSQKALSYYTLGKLFFEDKSFKLAQAYYDSAASFVTNKSPYFDEIKTVAAVLKDYIKFQNTIQRNDSLLTLAKLSENELIQYIDNLIEQEKKKQELQQKQQQSLSNNMNYMTDINTPNFSGFYFDNQQIVASGKNEFRRFWGERKNEDHWRRSNKEQSFEITDSQNPDNPSNLVSSDPQKTREAYMKNIPKSDSAQKAMHLHIQEAYIELGNIYAYKLNVPDSAIFYWKKLLSRYPDSEFAPKAAYSLFVLYNKLNNSTETAFYKNYITQNYPNSNFDKLIRGEKFQESDNLSPAFSDAYNGLVGAYSNEQYALVISMANHLLNTFPSNSLTPKILYMKAMAFGFNNQKDSLKIGLEYLVKNFPDDPTAKNAQKTLNLMKGINPDNDPKNKPFDPKTTPHEENFVAFVKELRPKEQVYVIYFIPQKNVPLNELKVAISNFNKNYFSEKNLTSLVFSYQGTHHLGQVQPFENFKEADRYIQLAQKDETLKKWLSIEPDKAISFMSLSNFRIAYGQRKMNDYLDFYTKYKDEMLKK